MKVLLVAAHPLQDSLCLHLCAHAEAGLRAAGHEVDRLDLYDEQFSPLLSADERRQYYVAPQPGQDLAAQQHRLISADAIVLVFPTWWFSMPAILKGWFDRVWAPGVAFEHGTPIRPRLTKLRSLLAITTLGSPWWFDRLVMWQPVARVLRRGILLACAPQAKFGMLSLHDAEQVSPARLRRFEARLIRALPSGDRAVSSRRITP